MKFLYESQLDYSYKAELTILDPFPADSNDSNCFRQHLLKYLKDDVLLFASPPFHISNALNERAVECCTTVPTYDNTTGKCSINPVGPASRINIRELAELNKVFSDLAKLDFIADGETDFERSRAFIINTLQKYPDFECSIESSHVVLFADGVGVLKVDYMPPTIQIVEQQAELAVAVLVDLRYVFNNQLLRGFC